MKILFVNRLMGIFWGGGESFDYNLTKTLKKLGHEINILTGKPIFSQPKNKIYDIKSYYLSSPYLRWISYKLGGKLPKKIPTIFMLVDLYLFQIKAFKWIKKNRNYYDVIQILNLPILAKKIVDDLKIPVVVRFPGPPSERWELNVYKKIKNKHLIKFFAAGDVIRYIKEKNFSIENIPQGVDSEKFRKTNSNIRLEYNIPKEDVVLISVGRLVKGKGFEFLIDGFKEICDRFSNVKLIIVGDGALRDSLEKKVRKFNLEKKIIFAGAIKHDDLPKYYSIADIFLLLSEYENFSNAVLEAMSCELPVIATDVGGFPLQIKDGVNGFLVKYSNIKDLVEKVSYLVQDAQVRRKIGELNRQEVIKNYTWDSSANKVLTLYEKVINNKKNKKILFFIPNLGGGGAERIMSLLLNYFSDKLNVVAVFFNDKHVYSLPSKCKVYYIDYALPKKGLFRKFMRLIRLRKIIKRETPDVVLSFLANLYLIVATIFPKRLNVKLVISERNSISYTLKYSRNSELKKIVSKMLYRFADIIIAVSDGVKKDLIKTLNLNETKIEVVYNPQDIEQIQRLATQEVKHPWLIDKKYPVIINVGRLIYQKGQDILLKAFKIINEKIDSRLIILGEGPLLEELKNLTKELGIIDKVDFVGFKKNPFAYISRSDVFVLSSRWEGFPNVLIEAMACGVPVISTDCPSGPNEIIINNINGLLVSVENWNELADNILKLLTNKDLQTKFVIKNKESIKKFALERILNQYLELFNSL